MIGEPNAQKYTGNELERTVSKVKEWERLGIALGYSLTHGYDEFTGTDEDVILVYVPAGEELCAFPERLFKHRVLLMPIEREK